MGQLLYNTDKEVMNDKNKAVKQIPYGISNYGAIWEDNCYYVDKTQYLENFNRLVSIFYQAPQVWEIFIDFHDIRKINYCMP